MSVLGKAGWNATACCQSGPYGPAYAIDNNLSTTYQSESGGYPHWFRIDLGCEQTFDYLKVTPHPNGSLPLAVELLGSHDDVFWDSLASVTWTGDAQLNPKFIVLLAPVTYRYVKLAASTGVDNVMMFVEVDLGNSSLAERDTWSIWATNSYSGYPETKAIDGSFASFWASDGGYPLSLTVDMGKPFYIDGVRYSPRQDGCHDWFGAVELYVSDDGATWGSAIATATWAGNYGQKAIGFTGVTKRWFKLLCNSGASGSRNLGSCSELWAGPGGTPPPPGGGLVNIIY